jgi:hypothetical protein
MEYGAADSVEGEPVSCFSSSCGGERWTGVRTFRTSKRPPEMSFLPFQGTQQTLDQHSHHQRTWTTYRGLKRPAKRNPSYTAVEFKNTP